MLGITVGVKPDLGFIGWFGKAPNQSWAINDFQQRLQSLITKYKEGMSTKVIRVANKIPKPIETAIGISIRA